MAEEKINYPNNLAKGRETKRRKALVKAEGIDWDDAYIKATMDKIDGDHFDLLVNDELAKRKQPQAKAEEPQANQEPSAKEIELEQREADLDRKMARMEEMFEAQEKVKFNQSDVDSIIEKKMLEMGLKKGDDIGNETNMVLLRKMTEAMEMMSRSNNDGRVQVDPIAAHEIDIEDVIDEPVFFFSFHQAYTIWGDRRKGQAILNPFTKPIKFDPEYRQVKNGANGKEVIAVSRCKIISRKELDYLRTHTLYGITFFENLEEATTADAMIADSMQEAAGVVNSMSQYAVVERARLLQIPVSSDTDLLRKQIIQKMAKESMSHKSNKSSTLLDGLHPTAQTEIMENGVPVGRVDAPQVS
jgi:hypothetical protein